MLVLEPKIRIPVSPNIKPIKGHWIGNPMVDSEGNLYHRPFHADGMYSPALTDEEMEKFYSHRPDCNLVNIDGLKRAKWTRSRGWISLNY